MKFTGSSEFEQFWTYLEDETPRGVAVVVASYFDEKLGDLLPAAKGKRFAGRITDALAAGIISKIEHDDFDIIRGLRNSFAHELRSKDFDADKTAKVESLQLWTKPSSKNIRYGAMFPGPRERLLYVAAVLAVRLNNRKGATVPVHHDPEVWRSDDWPPVTSI